MWQRLLSMKLFFLVTNELAFCFLSFLVGVYYGVLDTKHIMCIHSTSAGGIEREKGGGKATFSILYRDGGFELYNSILHIIYYGLGPLHEKTHRIDIFIFT